MLLVAAFVIGLLVARVIPGLAPLPADVGAQPAPLDDEVASTDDLSAEELRNIEIFRAASPSVVNITSLAYRRGYLSMDLFQIPQGTGSGFVWDRNGHVVTNYHVIEGGERFSVTLFDQSEWEAEIVGTAPDKDLAVLRLAAPAEKLAPLPLGRSRTLLVGQSVLALGNPFPSRRY